MSIVERTGKGGTRFAPTIPGYTTGLKSDAGITLLEVLVAIFIMGIGMLALLTLFPLGALSMRNALNHDRAHGALTMTARAQSVFREEDRDRNGIRDYAGSLSVLALSGALKDAGLGNGQKQGYLFTIARADQTSWQAIAFPASVGLSGEKICTIDQTGTLRCSLAPGAQEARERVTVRLIERTRQTACRLLTIGSVADSTKVDALVQAYQSSPAVASSFDLNGDGLITFPELFDAGAFIAAMQGMHRYFFGTEWTAEVRAQAEIESILREHFDFIREELKLGIAGEETSLIPGIAPGAVFASPGAADTYVSLLKLFSTACP